MIFRAISSSLFALKKEKQCFTQIAEGTKKQRKVKMVIITLWSSVKAIHFIMLPSSTVGKSIAIGKSIPIKFANKTLAK